MKRLLLRRRGFTLVEVSLALLVMAVGVLGAFALFPHALSESQRASAETQSSMFAESVFQTLRARAQQQWSSVHSSFTILGPGALDAGTSVWADPKPVIRAGTPQENYICYVRMFGQTMVEISLRYRLQIESAGDNIKIATLIIWPGMYGDTEIPSQYGIPEVPTYVYVTALYREYFTP